MSDLIKIYNDKMKFEKLFGMSSGNVINFSNNLFCDFVKSVLNINIYNEKYKFRGSSKANRLRCFWEVENNYNVSKLNQALLDYWKEYEEECISSPYYDEENGYKNNVLYEQCKDICKKLKDNTAGENLENLNIEADDKNLHILYEQIKESIAKNSPETALDRLHTFVFKYIRSKAKKYGIECDNDKALHSVFGEYLKKIDKKNLIESEMSKRILKYSISFLEAFNDVRNYNSYAHDNELLKNEESHLILNNIIGLLKFIDYIDPDIKDKNAEQTEEDNEDLPF